MVFIKANRGLELRYFPENPLTLWGPVIEVVFAVVQLLMFGCLLVKVIN